MQTSRRAFLACVPAALAVAMAGLSAKPKQALLSRTNRVTYTTTATRYIKTGKVVTAQMVMRLRSAG